MRPQAGEQEPGIQIPEEYHGGTSREEVQVPRGLHIVLHGQGTALQMIPLLSTGRNIIAYA